LLQVLWFKKGINIIISLQHLEFLELALQENMVIYITRTGIANKNHYFNAIVRPTYPSPIRQLKANPSVIINKGGNQLECQSHLVLYFLIDDDAFGRCRGTTRTLPSDPLLS
jgi:hypothetical protein